MIAAPYLHVHIPVSACVLDYIMSHGLIPSKCVIIKSGLGHQIVSLTENTRQLAPSQYCRPSCTFLLRVKLTAISHGVLAQFCGCSKAYSPHMQKRVWEERIAPHLSPCQELAFSTVMQLFMQPWVIVLVIYDRYKSVMSR